MPKISSKNFPKTKELYSVSSNVLCNQNDEPSNILDDISNNAFNNSICTCNRCPIHKDLQNNNGLYILMLQILNIFGVHFKFHVIIYSAN